MDGKIIDSISDNLFHVYPLIYKKLLKVDFESVQEGLTYLHFLILRMLARTGALPISEIGRRLLIPRPQMTHLVDQLIDLRLVTRRHGEEDRRIIYVELTGEGQAGLKKCGELIRLNVRTKLASLNESELAELSEVMVKLDSLTARLR